MVISSGRGHDEILAGLSSDNITELLAFERVEPFGDQWRQTCKLIAAIYNHGGFKDGDGCDRFWREEDIMAFASDDDDEPLEPEVFEETEEDVESVFAGVGVKVIKPQA